MSIFSHTRTPLIAGLVALALGGIALSTSAEARVAARHTGRTHVSVIERPAYASAPEYFYGAPYAAYASSDWPYYQADEPYFSGPEWYRRSYYRPF